MIEPNIHRTVRIISVIFVLTSCLFTVRSQILFAMDSGSRSIASGIKLEFRHRNDKIIKIVEVRNIDKDTWIDDLRTFLASPSTYSSFHSYFPIFSRLVAPTTRLYPGFTVTNTLSTTINWPNQKTYPSNPMKPSFIRFPGMKPRS